KNQRGEPVADAWVRAHSVAGDGTTTEANTDEYGKFEFSGLPVSSYELVAGRDSDKQETPGVTVRSGSHRVALVLPEAATITGRVLLDGKPLGYFGVKVTDQPDYDIHDVEAARSPDGRFVASGLRPGSWSLVIV